MSDRHGNVFLVGPMGSGKTTIGRIVARALGLEFVDCDSELERRTGATVNLIFDIEGEAGFRERETRMHSELARRDRGAVQLDVPTSQLHRSDPRAVRTVTADLSTVQTRHFGCRLVELDRPEVRTLASRGARTRSPTARARRPGRPRGPTRPCDRLG